MAVKPPTTLFFAGTDTEVGKTYCASLAASGLSGDGYRVGVYKPVASDCRRNGDRWVCDDAVSLWEAAGRPGTLGHVCPQCFEAPLAPPEAARAENRTVDPALLRRGADRWTSGPFDVVIVEGAGGLMSPLADGVLNVDLLLQLRPASLIIVAANRLGVIHQVLSCCEAARARGVVAAGIVLSSPRAEADPSVAANADQIARYTDVPILGELAHGATEAPWLAESILRGSTGRRGTG